MNICHQCGFEMGSGLFCINPHCSNFKVEQWHNFPNTCPECGWPISPLGLCYNPNCKECKAYMKPTTMNSSQERLKKLTPLQLLDLLSCQVQTAKDIVEKNGLAYESSIHSKDEVLFLLGDFEIRARKY